MVMKKSATTSNLRTYLQQHWFKFFFLAIILYLFISKDFSFSINMNSPLEEGSMELVPQEQTQKKQIFTERKNESKENSTRFEMPSLFGTSKNYNPMMDLNKIDDKTKHDYLKRFAHVVINERRKFGIPSSIILANGLLQSHAGQRDMAKIGNNHFAIACSINWEGESGSYQGICFRHYENAWASFRDHSLYLTSGKYAPLSTLGSADYKAWAYALEKIGYADVKNLANSLIEIIELYGLNELDNR